MELAILFHNTMVSILQARAKAVPLPGRQAGHSESQLREWAQEQPRDLLGPPAAFEPDLTAPEGAEAGT